MKKVVLATGSKLQKIGEKAFRRTGIKEFAVPASLRVIGEQAFCLCENLKRVYFLAETESTT